ncbi:hypothetical protein K0M31_006780 [Melipona bicolor]|uniref:Potassium voltage-gated channel subfamily KQT member 1 n=1 Tax=Melipona bicolor TaxID=60889 RepID=A0AA40FS89_9HYME|nr:hypothetical protein K0M31_006780 [Melipona bicolor]
MNGRCQPFSDQTLQARGSVAKKENNKLSYQLSTAAIECGKRNRGPLNVTIVQVGKGNEGSGDGGSDLLRLEPSELRPAPSPLSDTSATLQSENNDTFSGGVDPRLLLGANTGGDRNTWEGRYRVKEHRRAGKATFQGQVYNFLERPTGWKCFLYHFSV